MYTLLKDGFSPTMESHHYKVAIMVQDDSKLPDDGGEIPKS